MKKIITFTLLLSALIVCGCSKDNENTNAVVALISPELTFNVNHVMFKMIGVQGGTFTMGATDEQKNEYYPNEMPTHIVTLSDYYIGQTEVTQALWEAVMESNPSNHQGKDFPVENVSWNEIQTFITRLNSITKRTFRLPTEAEWEYAARGGNQSKNYKYSGSNTIDNVTWYYDNAGNQTHTVGTKAPNELGLYDMNGNVWEWCLDWFRNYRSHAQYNPIGPATGDYRVYRGGGWNSLASYCRVSNRSGHAPNNRFNIIGFRLALVQ